VLVEAVVALACVGLHGVIWAAAVAAAAAAAVVVRVSAGDVLEPLHYVRGIGCGGVLHKLCDFVRMGG
jgi:hypothetical protein